MTIVEDQWNRKKRTEKKTTRRTVFGKFVLVPFYFRQFSIFSNDFHQYSFFFRKNVCFLYHGEFEVSKIKKRNLVFNQ